MSPLSIFSIIQPLFLQKPMSLYPHPNYSVGQKICISGNHVSGNCVIGKPRYWHHVVQGLIVYAAKSKKVMYSITFVILPVTKTIFSTHGCFSASLGLKMNIDSLSWPYGHLRLSNLSFPALVTLENNHSYQKLFPTLGK